MAVATTRSVALRGSEGHLVEVQVDVSQGMVGTSLVGRAGASLSEAKDRVRMAVSNACPPWPASRRVTILLSPADLPKAGSHYDLAIAVAAKAAALRAGACQDEERGGKQAQIPQEALVETAFIGELALSGALRAVPGVLPMVLAASAAGVRRVFVPETQASEAALVPGMTVFGVRSLAQVVAELRGEEVPDAPPIATQQPARLLTWRGDSARDFVDMADVEGLVDTKYAVEVAAAGGHHLMLAGPRGAGKTTLAERIPTILPDLDVEQALEVTAIHSLAGALGESRSLLRRPPFLAPHHDASKASIIGGGSGVVRPGAVSQAHHGVLFLDEFPLMRSDVVDALREPLESGEVTIARGEDTATFPAKGMVVLAANPCPCGNHHPLARGTCECPEVARRRYRTKLSGPMADRVDIWRQVDPQEPAAGRDGTARAEGSEAIRARVATARERQAVRYAERRWRLNGAVPGPALTADYPLASAGRDLLEAQLAEGALTRRGVTRVHRVAWTVADLAGVERPGRDEVDVALRLRTGQPLPVRTLGVIR